MAERKVGIYMYREGLANERCVIVCTRKQYEIRISEMMLILSTAGCKAVWRDRAKDGPIRAYSGTGPEVSIWAVF